MGDGDQSFAWLSAAQLRRVTSHWGWEVVEGERVQGDSQLLHEKKRWSGAVSEAWGWKSGLQGFSARW